MLKSKQCFTFKSDEIHIWFASFSKHKNDVAYFFSLLSEDEQKRAESFRFARGREQFIITRGILRCLLSRYLEETPKAIKIIYEFWGKPCLCEEKSLHFNVSHSGDYVVFAFARKYEIGIDIEYINKDMELNEMTLTIFSGAELDYWKKLCSEEKTDFFFKSWVGKEAFLKALGKGWLENDIKIKFEELYSFKQKLNSEIPKNKLGVLHYFQSIPGYAGAFFIKGPSLKPIFFDCERIVFRNDLR